MDNRVAITIKLDAPECVRGESVFFDVTLEALQPLQGLPTLDPHNRNLSVIAKGPDGTFRGNALSADERDGIHEHGPRHPQVASVNAGVKWSVRGDLLSWLGELPHGNYEVIARYTGLRVDIDSPPVTLKVLPAAPVQLSTPHYGKRMPMAPPTAEWVHKAAEGSFLAFYQRYSPNLPRNPRRCIRMGSFEDAPPATASTIAKADVAMGHIVWGDERGRLHFVAADVEKPKVGPVVEIKANLSGTLLASPLTLGDGRLLVPVADNKVMRVVLLEVSPDGSAKQHELDIGKKPLGPHTCFWEYDARLHFLWAAPDGREVMHARLPLMDMASGFITRSAHISNDPVLTMAGYVDMDSQFVGATIFEQQVDKNRPQDRRDPTGPKVMAWCVSGRGGKLSTARINITEGYSKQDQPIAAMGFQNLRGVASVCTHRGELAMLLLNNDGQLAYGSTVRRSVSRLADVVGQSVTMEQFPGLMAAGERGLEPWVYLRYLDAKGQRIAFARLEPANEPDPVERRASMEQGLAGGVARPGKV